MSSINWTKKLLSGMTAALSGYTLFRGYQANQFVTRARLRSIQDDAQLDSYHAQYTNFVQGAPVASELSNWLGVRHVEMRAAWQQAKAHVNNVVFTALDNWLPLGALLVSVGVGFGNELRQIGAMFGRVFPKTNYSRVAQGAFNGTLKATEGTLRAGSNLVGGTVRRTYGRSPIPALALTALAGLGLYRFARINTGAEAQDDLRGNLNRFTY
jgi:hypothetical protein